MTEYYLGVDIGATKSHALVADDVGQVLGFGSAGPGNHEVVGWDGFQTVLQSITQEALRSAALKPAQISGAGFGVAGYDWPSQRQPTLDGIQTLGLDSPMGAVNDAVLGLFAGTSEGWGIAIISGTGENCWGADRERNYGHMTGNSALMGEYGGAGTIVQRALREVAREWGQRGPKTGLSTTFIERTGAKNLDDLLEGLVMGTYHLHAGDAPLVFEVAMSGDPVAGVVIRWAGVELADMINGVSRQLNIAGQFFEVVLIGSTFKGGNLLLDPMKEAVRAISPEAKFMRLSAPPVVGGVLLGMEQAGRDGYVIREQLILAAQELIERQESVDHDSGTMQHPEQC
jgi:N-acetylglucosamine kinase-like BadF-type ATPase